MFRNRKSLIGLAVMIIAIAAVACSSSDDSPFSTTTPVSTSAPAPTAAPAPTEVPQATAAPEPPASAGDPAAGEAVFTGQSCNACHSTGSNDIVGPGLAGISAKGDAYIRESIVDPLAVIADGFAPLMPTSFGDTVQGEDLDNLVAYLLTLE